MVCYGTVRYYGVYGTLRYYGVYGGRNLMWNYINLSMTTWRVVYSNLMCCSCHLESGYQLCHPCIKLSYHTAEEVLQAAKTLTILENLFFYMHMLRYIPYCPEKIADFLNKKKIG